MSKEQHKELVIQVVRRLLDDCSGPIREMILDISRKYDLTTEQSMDLLPVVMVLVKDIIFKSVDMCVELAKEDRR